MASSSDFNPLKKGKLFLEDVGSSVLYDNFTSRISILKYEEQLAVLYLIKFVNYYNSHQLENEFSEQPAIKKAIRLYTELATGLDEFKKSSEEESEKQDIPTQIKEKVSRIAQNIQEKVSRIPQNIKNIEKHSDALSEFDKLDDFNRNNINNLLYFLSDSKLREPNTYPDPLFRSFNNLTTKINAIFKDNNV